MGNINQIDTNTCHHNTKLDEILNHLHLIWDIQKSPINEYGVTHVATIVHVVLRSFVVLTWMRDNR